MTIIPPWWPSALSLLGLLPMVGCHAPADASETSEAPISWSAVPPVEQVVPAFTIEPFTIILGTRGGRHPCYYDYTFDSNGRGSLKVYSSKNVLLPSLFRPLAQVTETDLDPEAIQRVASVLQTSLLRTSQGAYGGEFGNRNSSRFHVPRRSIDLITPTGRRRIEFPRIFAWQEFAPEDQEVLLAFMELWAAVEPTIPDERLRDFTTEWAAVR